MNEEKLYLRLNYLITDAHQIGGQIFFLDGINSENEGFCLIISKSFCAFGFKPDAASFLAYF